MTIYCRIVSALQFNSPSIAIFPGIIHLHAVFHVVVAVGMYELLTIYDYNYVASALAEHGGDDGLF